MLVQTKWNIPSFHLRACYHKTSMKSDSDAIWQSYYRLLFSGPGFNLIFLRIFKFTNVSESQLAEE